MNTRREFVQSASALAGWMVVKPQSVRGSQANSAVTVGLIGVGGRGTYDAGIFVKDPRARVTALCDLFDDRLDAGATRLKLEKPALFKDYEKLLAARDLDAVLIATPPFEHPRMFEAAVQARKHIYCEKPMGVDAAGCRRVIAAAKKADPAKNIAVGFQQRYGPVYLEAYKRLQEGQIGELAVVRGAWIGGNPFQKRPYPPDVEHVRNWFCYKDYSGDIIVEQDCHNFDVFHWFLGSLPTRAIGWGGIKVRTELEILDHLSVIFEFPGGMHVNYEANQITPRGFSNVGEQFTGTKGTLATSRAQMVHYKGPGMDDAETIKSPRDITIDAIETFLSNILSGKVENAGVRSAESTLIAILGRTAIYEKREVSWNEVANA